MQNLEGSMKARKQENKSRARQNESPKKAYKKAYSV